MEVYYFSSISYGFLRQRPQQIFDAWATKRADGRSFFFVEPPRIELRAYRNHEATHLIGLPLDDRQFNLTVEQLLSGWSTPQAMERAAVCSVFWEPFISKRDFEVICYDYFDPVHTDEPIGPVYLDRHVKMLAKSDLIFTTTEDFRRDVLVRMPTADVTVVSNGVDTAFFAAQRERHRPDDFHKTRRTVGFLGAVSAWVDLGLVLWVAENLPNVDFVVVGPISQ